jgi:hypothetical protein
MTISELLPPSLETFVNILHFGHNNAVHMYVDLAELYFSSHDDGSSLFQESSLALHTADWAGLHSLPFRWD